MHKQDHTTTDKGLDTIVESMYSEDCGPLHASKEPFVRKKGPDKNKKFKKHPLDKEEDDEFKPKKEAASHAPHESPCDHCNGTGNHDDGSTCPKCDGTGVIILGSEAAPEYRGPHKRSRIDVDALDDEQYGQPSLGDLSLSPDESELTATLVDADGNSHSIAINMMDPVKVKLRPAQGPGAGESIIQLAFTVHPEETDRIPPSSKWQDDPTRNPNAPSPTG